MSNESMATASEVYEMIKAEGFKCYLTGWAIDVNNFHLDHLQPLAMGGTNAASNLRAVIPEANRAKGAVSLERFVEICCAVAAKHGGMVRQDAKPCHPLTG